jgi:Kef-type K+ transport system membrane component KefB
MALSIVRQMAGGLLDFSQILVMIANAAVFLVAGTVIGQQLLTRLIHRIDASQLAIKHPELVFIFAMMIAFLYAMAAEMMGLSAIVGAFVAGVALEGVQLRFSMNFKEGAEYLRIVFGAVFFTSLGVLAELHVLDLSILWFALLLTLVALASKLVGCGLTARLVGMSKQEAWVVGVGMAPRGEVVMVVALLALNEKIIQQTVFLSLIIMCLLTMVVVPLVLRNWLYRDRGTGNASKEI